MRREKSRKKEPTSSLKNVEKILAYNGGLHVKINIMDNTVGSRLLKFLENKKLPGSIAMDL